MIQKLANATIETGPDKTELEKAYNYAVYLLGLRLRTEGELREKLRNKKHKTEIVDKVIRQLEQYRYLDDRRYAEVYTENLKKYKSLGFFGIKRKLMEKRLPSQIIEEVMRESLDEEEEIKIANKFLKKMSVSLFTQEQKAGAFRKLTARGFRGSVIGKIIF
ncbi:MAG: RecX family transcriptional regulator [Candidatus Doudnabacteria bacterium]|nr:RecX family transcriptional regulator [Candidatus Doudnabacteria bacterium]